MQEKQAHHYQIKPKTLEAFELYYSDGLQKLNTLPLSDRSQLLIELLKSTADIIQKFQPTVTSHDIREYLVVFLTATIEIAIIEEYTK